MPGKNLMSVGGRPLIRWTIDAALASRYIDRLILSSDDPAIMDAAARAGCEVPFRRDAALATDEASSIAVAADALRHVPGFDVLVLLQPTSPLRATEDIDGALELFEASNAPTCVTVRAAMEHPYWTFHRDGDGKLRRYCDAAMEAASRRQDLPPAWCLNGAVYIALTSWLLREGTFVSGETVGYPMPAERSLDIDTPEDVEQLRRIVEGAGTAQRTHS